MVIYTSGTTGLPKGINNNHFKLCATGIGVSQNIGLGRDDVGYACMPLFHSNSMFVGFMPASGSAAHRPARALQRQPVRARRASRYGVTFWNYVGEPVHYVLAAIEKRVRRRRGADPPRGHRQPAEQAALRGRQRRVAARHRPLHALDGPRGHVRALRLDRGGDQHLPPQGRSARQRRRGHRRRGEDPARERQRVRARASSTPTARSLNYDSGGRRDLPRRDRHRPLPGLLRQPRREQRRSTATASTTPATSATCSSATASATCSSTAAPTTGSARTARTSRRCRSGACCPSTPTCRSPSPTACRARSRTSW